MIETRDITGDVRTLHPAIQRPDDIPMYSFERPATAFWQGAYNVLTRQGLSHEQAVEWLQSKHPRWLFDGCDEDVIRYAEALVSRYILRNGTAV